MKLSLHDSIISPQDLKALILEIKQYAGWFMQADVKKRVTGREEAEAPVLSAAATALIGQTGEQPSTRAGLDQLVEALEQFAGQAPIVNITLAAPPGGRLKKALVTWCRKNIDPGALVSFDFNGTLLGGMVVRYGSHIFDWSWRRQLLDARSSFPEVLRRV